MENSTTASHHTTEMPPSHLSTTLTMNTMNEMDLNPIEHLWDVLDKQVRSMEAPPHNLEELKDLLVTPWCQIPQHTFRGLEESMPRPASHHTTVMPPSHLITTLTMNTMNEMVHTHVNDASLQVIMWAAVLLRYVCHHKGSYKTHEPKDEENPKTDVQDSSDEEEAEPRKQEECISSSGSAFQDDTPEDI
ncbi:uncharacterized protein LOC134303830 isoform X2 [Trichomycterus rosablanca]|uniref:uncharacterized protein LOC134303830 isoform X2 n=1 Tax=Trichomycterus rosablanca TaxID=2290929 RepID=UPI002F350E0E